MKSKKLITGITIDEQLKRARLILNSEVIPLTTNKLFKEEFEKVRQMDLFFLKILKESIYDRFLDDITFKKHQANILMNSGERRRIVKYVMNEVTKLKISDIDFETLFTAYKLNLKLN